MTREGRKVDAIEYRQLVQRPDGRQAHGVVLFDLDKLSKRAQARDR